MMSYKTENPWNIQSIYELQYFGCPSCEYRNNSKQQFVNHAYEYHPTCIDNLLNIKDDSFDDILCPWESIDIKLENNLTMELTEESFEDQNNESFLNTEYDTHFEESDYKDIKPEKHFTMELTEDSLRAEDNTLLEVSTSDIGWTYILRSAMSPTFTWDISILVLPITYIFKTLNHQSGSCAIANFGSLIA